MILNISGIEGVGKSSAAKAISEALKNLGIEVVKTREPGGTPIAEELRRLLKHFETSETFHPMTELLLFYGARFQLFKNLIIPEVQKGNVVVSDRSYACTFAYQLRAANVIKEDDFWTIHNLVMRDMPEYDIIFHLFTDSVEEGLARARGRGELDRIESNEVAFFERADAGYHEFFKDKPNVIRINTSENNEAQVAEIITNALNERMT